MSINREPKTNIPSFPFQLYYQKPISHRIIEYHAQTERYQVKRTKRRRCFKPRVSSSSSSFPIAVEGRPSAEAVQATEAEAERSAAHAVLVDDDSAACEVMVSDAVRAVGLSEGVLTGVLAAPVLSPHKTHCWLCVEFEVEGVVVVVVECACLATFPSSAVADICGSVVWKPFARCCLLMCCAE